MKTRIIILAVILPFMLTAQSMRQNAAYSLFSDNKAAMPGDAVTIIVLESTHASNNAATSAGRKSEAGFGMSGAIDKTTLPNVDFDINSGNDFSGEGSTQTTGSIRTKISAVVDTVLANGNLRIRGSKKITINGEDQIVKISGVIRTSDIRTDNTVYSHNITDADISFEGSGLIDNAQKPGWLTKLFHWLF